MDRICEAKTNPEYWQSYMNTTPSGCTRLRWQYEPPTCQAVHPEFRYPSPGWVARLTMLDCVTRKRPRDARLSTKHGRCRSV